MSLNKPRFPGTWAAHLAAALLLSLPQAPAAGQVKDPELPLSPDVEFKDQSDAHCFSAEISYAGGSASGDICFKKEFFRCGKVQGGKVYWRDVSSILVIQWVRRPEGKSYLFYPEAYEVSLKDGRKIRVDGNIRELNRLHVPVKKRRLTLYSYYYDEYASGKWKNSGAEDFYQPSRTPANGCVTLIVFR